jgi:hypothetical protein
MQRSRPVLSIALAALVMAAVPGAASAKPFTDTQIERVSETFSDPFLCHDELYQQTVTGIAITHITSETDEEGNFIPPLHFHFLVHAKVMATPVDGTGPSYEGHFRSSDTESIRSVKHGEVNVEQDTDWNQVIAKGSDGSRVRLREHHHFTYNANGEVTVEFDRFAASC